MGSRLAVKVMSLELNFSNLFELSGLCAALASASKTGLIAYISEQRNETTGAPAQFSAASAASKLNLNKDATNHVLHLLAAYKMLEKKDGQYELTQDAAKFADLVPEGPSELCSVWGHTEEYLKTGAVYKKNFGGSAKERESSYKTTVSKLVPYKYDAAKDLAEILKNEISCLGRVRVLDIGAGSGVWSLMLASMVEESHVTAVDFEKVLPNFYAMGENLGIKKERLSEIPGDCREVNLPDSEFDVVFIANLLHLETAANCKEIVNRAAKALKKGGKLIIIDGFGSSDRSEQRRSVYSLHLAIRTTGGQSYSFLEYQEWMASAGLVGFNLIELQSDVLRGTSALVGSREE